MVAKEEEDQIETRSFFVSPQQIMVLRRKKMEQRFTFFFCCWFHGHLPVPASLRFRYPSLSFFRVFLLIDCLGVEQIGNLISFIFKFSISVPSSYCNLGCCQFQWDWNLCYSCTFVWLWQLLWFYCSWEYTVWCHRGTACRNLPGGWPSSLIQVNACSCWWVLFCLFFFFRFILFVTTIRIFSHPGNRVLVS